MDRTSPVIAAIVPAFLLACAGGAKHGATPGTDAGVPRAVGGDASPTSAALDIPFSDVCLSAPVGSQSQTIPLTVKNASLAASGPLGTTLNGPAATSFAITSDTCTGVALEPQASCTVVVVYAPTAAHATAERATLVVSNGQTSVAASLVGSDLGKVTLSPALLSFGEVAAGTLSKEIFVDVTTTSACWTQWSATIDNPRFVVTSNLCSDRLRMPGELCRIGVRLAPWAGTTPSPITGQMIVSAGDSGTATLALDGVVVTGAPPGNASLTASPTAIDFGTGVFTMRGQAVVAVTVGSTTPTGLLTGPDAGQFILAANTCQGSLPPGTTCTMLIEFAPTDWDASNATLNISDGQRTIAVSLAGKNVPL